MVSFRFVKRIGLRIRLLIYSLEGSVVYPDLSDRKNSLASSGGDRRPPVWSLKARHQYLTTVVY